MRENAPLRFVLLHTRKGVEPRKKKKNEDKKKTARERGLNKAASREVKTPSTELNRVAGVQNTLRTQKNQASTSKTDTFPNVLRKPGVRAAKQLHHDKKKRPSPIQIRRKQRRDAYLAA